MKPSIFGYEAPTTLEAAISLLAGDPDAMVLAGGQTLLPAMNFRAANPSLLVDIQHIQGLRGIVVGSDAIIVKAMVRHREFELDEDVKRANPLIAEVMQHVAHIPIRNRGTVVGSLCHADPSAEMPLLLALLGGSVIAQGPSGSREIAAEKFFQSFLTTARSHDEIVVEARFPLLPARAGWAFDEVTRRHGDYAVVGIGCVLSMNGSGRATGIRLAACGIADRPIRLKEAEAILDGTTLGASDLDAAVAVSVAAVTQPDDINVSQSYRRRALGTLIRRMVAKAAQRAEIVA
ncbi:MULTISPECIES: xanthine dehydrogenase family protein subunit M [unclassified Bradyrhizobium]|uniref:FAD binding domain-containing protein n=1 Tax=unclassified Bradyrhizobium TaxID=2631580 RepID=UPI001FFA59C8|nr:MULTISPECIES: xanthine dehydrogenase family protein subunit M [unclassified Bradyrhizobium]MCK1713396.1 xanthine dehydrogenase family protein subunit M [Bradyrhizobium sp. 143]MCK1730441.1 xanthine dehydrogenase family protein subunit M [Bradyrhizobium sp. 142]